MEAGDPASWGRKQGEDILRVKSMTRTRTQKGTNLPEPNLQTNLIKDQRDSILLDIGLSLIFKTAT